MSTPAISRTGSPALRIASVTAGLYGIEFADLASNHSLDRDLGVRSHDVADVWAIFTSPLVHANWPHLLGNTIPFVIFGYLVLRSGWREFFRVCAVAAVCSGAVAWLLSPAGTITLGASGVIMGLLTYLLARGIYTRSISQIALSVVLLLLFGGILWGVLPTQPGVSWQAHLGGAVGGVLAASRLRRRKASGIPA